MKYSDEFFTGYHYNAIHDKFRDARTFHMMSFSTVFKFMEPLTLNQQLEFLQILENAPSEFSTIDVCNYFIKKRIEYRIKFKYSLNLSHDRNIMYRECIKMLKKRLKEIELDRWHTIYGNGKNYPKKDGEYYVQTPADLKTGDYHIGYFYKKNRRFIVYDLIRGQDIKYWRITAYMDMHV